MMSQMIYKESLPEDLIMTLMADDQMIMDFVLGTRSLERAEKYGLQLTLVLGQHDPLSQTVECTISVSGQPYWITVWLIEYSPRYP